MDNIMIEEPESIAQHAHTLGTAIYVMQIGGLAMLFGDPAVHKGRRPPNMNEIIAGSLALAIPFYPLCRYPIFSANLISGLFAVPALMGGAFCLIAFGVSRNPTESFYQGLGVATVASVPSMVMSLLHCALTWN